MIYTKLNNTGIEISKICLGTMTWGEQNTEAEGHEQMDYAVDQGINFFDVAEMYPVPGKEHTQGSTEKIIGTWFRKHKNREKIVLATKVAGPSKGLWFIRNPLNYSREQIHRAIDGSLKRLQTDYIDLYQLHWPERKANFFGKLGYQHDPNDAWQDNFHEIAETMNELMQQGKIRHWGLSNETAWGAMHFIRTTEKNNLPGPITIQNPYSLLNRSYEVGLAEVSMRENMGLLAYSPLAFGVLSGKYLNNHNPEDGRLTLFPVFKRYSSPQAKYAAEQYVKLANKHGISPVQMALAYVNSRPFVTSNIIGATKMDQLKENIDSIRIELEDEVIKDIEAIHVSQPNPAP